MAGERHGMCELAFNDLPVEMCAHVGFYAAQNGQAVVDRQVVPKRR
jgi:hypothetical protein